LLLSTRPTAVNLKWALERVYNKVINAEITDRVSIAKNEALQIEKEDIQKTM